MYVGESCLNVAETSQSLLASGIPWGIPRVASIPSSIPRVMSPDCYWFTVWTHVLYGFVFSVYKSGMLGVKL